MRWGLDFLFFLFQYYYYSLCNIFHVLCTFCSASLPPSRQCRGYLALSTSPPKQCICHLLNLPPSAVYLPLLPSPCSVCPFTPPECICLFSPPPYTAAFVSLPHFFCPPRLSNLTPTIGSPLPPQLFSLPHHTASCCLFSLHSPRHPFCYCLPSSLKSLILSPSFIAHVTLGSTVYKGSFYFFFMVC
ncbi:unnamed protein product [Acanthosepion pharaonis]|uniref:Uncharacterized protein n=1 Tax=Acanthosepion pharaonis TaxID=158019 RepID=A0A812DWF6_ACAPH|nr:unnamed protein product [Sepia pharaonis]